MIYIRDKYEIMIEITKYPLNTSENDLRKILLLLIEDEIKIKLKEYREIYEENKIKNCFGSQDCSFATEKYCINHGCTNEERDKCYEETMDILDKINKLGDNE